MRKSRIIVLAIVAGAALAPAQGARAQEMTPEMMETWAKYSNPGENHQHFNDMVGNWTHKVTMWMAPGAPPMESTATSTAERAPNAKFRILPETAHLPMLEQPTVIAEEVLDLVRRA